MNHPRLFAVGGAHMDRRGRIAGPCIAEASNPGTMREDVGGGTFNAARAAVQRDISVSLMSLRGGDTAGQQVAEAIEQAGIEDCSAIFLDRATPSYTAILTEEGELVTGLADMNLYEIGFPRQLRRRRIRDALTAADAILCDANMPAEALAQLVAVAEGRPIFAIAISPAKVRRLVPVFASLACLFMNRREACALAGLAPDAAATEAAATLVRNGLAAGVITAGSAPVLCFSQDGRFAIDAPPVERILDVTGAGDALAGATIAAWMRGLPLAEALREGMAAARLAVQSDRAAPSLNGEDFRSALEHVPPPRAIG